MPRSCKDFYAFFHQKRLALSAVQVLLLFGLACRSNGDNLAARDSALDRDLTLAGTPAPARPTVIPMGDTATSAPRQNAPQGQQSKQPQPQRPPAAVAAPVRTPARPRPQPEPAVTAPVTAAPDPSPATAPAPVAAAPTSAMKTIPGGSALSAETTSQLCSLANRPGDKIVANLTHEVVGPDGARLPVGTPVLLEMATAQPPADFAFLVKGVQVNGQLIPVDGQVTATGATNDRRVSKGGDKGKVATGAVIGAILGRVIGGGAKGTVIGAAGGAAAGTVMAARNSVVEHCLPSGASVTVTLTGPLVYPAANQ